MSSGQRSSAGIGRARRPAIRRSACAAVAFAVLLLAAPAGAADKGADARGPGVPFQDISSAGPLRHIYLGQDLSCQVQFAGETEFSFYPPDTAPGDCGTSIAVGPTVFGPDFASHDLTGADIGNDLPTPYANPSQSPVSGDGSPANPFEVTTTGQADDVTVTRLDSYTIGDKHYTSTITATKSGPGLANVVLYHGADCFLHESDEGFGAFDTGTGGIFCTENQGNRPPGQVIGFVPLSPESNYLETDFQSFWGAILSGSPFPDICECDLFQDNAAGLSWSFALAQGESQTRSVQTFEDPQGGVARNCAGKPATLISGGGRVTGTRRDDVIVGTDGRDRINGKGGDDRICGGDGRDKLKGGDGKDILKGGKSRDKLKGGPAKDRLRGGRGKDRLNGGAGDDECKSGPGTDRETSC